MEEERLVSKIDDGAADVGNPSSDDLKPGSGTSAGYEPPKKTRSCKGCLYYSSNLKSNSRNPVCVGFSRSLSQGHYYYVDESRTEAAKEGRTLADFKYLCAGFSAYADKKNSGNVHETKADLPICAGIKVLIDRRVTNAAETTPTHVHNKDGHALPQPQQQPRSPKPAQSAGDDFMSRFTRSATLVANGVAKNVRKVGNHVKETLEDLYPYGRRPK